MIGGAAVYTFGVRSSVGFAPPYIVVHGSIYRYIPDSASCAAQLNSGPSGPLPCLLWGKPDGNKLAENLAEHMLVRASAASRRGPPTGSVAQGQDRGASDESLDDKLSLPLALSLVLCGRSWTEDQQDERDARR